MKQLLLSFVLEMHHQEGQPNFSLSLVLPPTKVSPRRQLFFHMAPASSFSLLLILSSLLSLSSTPLAESQGQGFISLSISQKGLDFIKDLLIEQATSSLVRLYVSEIHKSIKIPFIGRVHVSLTNITLSRVNVSSSIIRPGGSGVAIVASGGTINLSTDWKYSYRTWLVPIDISDSGSADIRVEGMEVGLTLGMKDQGGILKLSLLECSCYLEDIFISLNGGASWFYQGLVDAFEGQIRSVVEKAINKRLKEGIIKLDTLLQKLPKEVKVDNITSLNATFVNDPLLSNSSVQFEINGLFTANGNIAGPKYYFKNSHALAFCNGPPEMLQILLDEAVFNSASDVYFKAGIMHWIIDKVPNQSLLNTASWKFIIPQLYKKYPNDDMLLNISLSSPPAIWIIQDHFDATVSADMTVEVIDGGKIIPVACISVVVRATGSLEVSGNNLAGQAGLDDFTMHLKWSKVGNFHMYLIQNVIRVFLKDVALPYVNLRLQRGFPLPIIDGFALKNAEILCLERRIVVCTDVTYADDSHYAEQLMMLGDQ